MGDRFLTRQVAQLALTANALGPLRFDPLMMPVFFAGWLTSELAPHLAALTVADAATHLRRPPSLRRTLGLAAATANVAAYGALIAAGRRAGAEIEDALVEALGPDYRATIARDPLPDDVAAPWSALAMPFRMTNVDVVRTKRVRYAPGGRRFELDVYRHRDTPPGAPVLLQVHGGGWVVGNKNQQGIPLMLHMAARGWVCVAVNYPLSPWARWPEHLIALKRAMQWIRGHGEGYGADPSFVAVTGGSAGGHLAAMLALTAGDSSLQPGFEDVDTSVQACVPHYGVYDLSAESGERYARLRKASLVAPFVMPRGASYPDDYVSASPHYRTRPDAPPFLVIHGRHDSLVPVIEARRFVDRLRAESTNPVAYAELGGAQHAFDVFTSLRSSAVTRGVARFLEWTHATRAAQRSAA